jgi:hypothetical protein
MPRYRHHSLGELISTVSFFGVSIFLLLSGFDWLEHGDQLRAWMSWFAACLCFLGSMRFRIAQIALALRKQNPE